MTPLSSLITASRITPVLPLMEKMQQNHISHVPILESGRVFEEFCRGNALSKQRLLSILPERGDFALLYRFLRDNNGYAQKIETLVSKLGHKLSFGKIRAALEAMSELGLIRIREGMKSSRIELNKTTQKVDLESASIIKKLREVTQ